MASRRFNPFTTSTNVDPEVRSTRPPTYTSNITAAPTCTTGDPRATSACDRNERASAWSASLPSASGVASPDSDSLLGEAESSVTDTVSVGGASVEVPSPAGPRYGELEFNLYRNRLNDPAFSVYYRAYTEDGAIPSKNPVYSDDPYLGCIAADLVRPSHIAINIKRCLSSVENIHDVTTTKLFTALSSQTPMEDACRVSILARK